MGKNNFNSLKTTILLYCQDEAFAAQFSAGILSYCPSCRLMSASDVTSVEQLLDSVQADVVLVDGRRSAVLMEAMGELDCPLSRSDRPSVLALIDRSTDHETELQLLAAGADDFICAEQPLHVAVRLKELYRLQEVKTVVTEYDHLLTGQSSQLHLLQVIVDNSHLMIATVDRQLKIQVANEPYLNFYQLEKSDVHGVAISEVITEKNYAVHVKPALLRALAGEDVCVQSIQALSHPQQPHLQLYMHPLRDGDDQITGAVLILNDISQLKSMEQRYSQMSHEFQTLLDGISDGITLIRADGSVAWGNRAAAKLLNTTVKELPANFCCISQKDHLVTSERPFCDNCLTKQCLDSGKKTSALLKAPDGRSLGVKVFPLLDVAQKVTGMIRMVSDVTESMQLRNEASQTSRLAALGELAAGVAHEINNPNGLLSINNEFLKDICGEMLNELSESGGGDMSFSGFSLAELKQELPLLFSNNRAATGSIRRIVEDLKKFTQQEQSHFERVDVNEVVLAAQRLVANSIKKATDSFHVCYGDDLPLALGSFQGLEQVVINLLMNACQALPSPACEISLKTMWDEATRQINIWVSDTGVGIAEQDLEKIFDPFFTTKREEGGTGLGLSVSSRIIKEHGGVLYYDSQPGQGTKVCVSLPVGESL